MTISAISVLKVFLRPVCCWNLTWWNLKGLAEFANLTVYLQHKFFGSTGLSLSSKVRFLKGKKLLRTGLGLPLNAGSIKVMYSPSSQIPKVSLGVDKS